MELLEELAGIALDHGDRAKALELVNAAQKSFDEHDWPTENHVPTVANIIKLRFRAADEAKARSDADAALKFYQDNRDKIVNIYRAGALRPLAEAYQTMGDTATAKSVYATALNEGTENPNSRPRAEDLSATCVSMALNGVEPDEAMWTRIRQIQGGLASPW
jgi:tetratricopeptide (TPR) repeat protein